RAQPQMPSTVCAVDDLASDASGVLWATTGEDRQLRTGVPAGTGRDLFRLIDGRWQGVDRPGVVWDDPKHWEIRAAHGGGVFVSAGQDGRPDGNGVYFTDGTSWELFEREFLCGTLAVDTSGQLWAVGPDFLTTLVDGKWVDVPEGWAAQSVTAGPDGSVWFTTFSAPPHTLMRFDGNSWTKVAECENCVGPRSILAIDDAGDAWAARGGCGLAGLSVFDPSGTREDLPQMLRAHDIAFTADGAAWVALPCAEENLPSGVARYLGGEVRLYDTDDGLVYAGTKFGVSRYDPTSDTWQPVG
ncbi:MAG: hypothetical protein P8N02_06385, partial [Actinomycetota bacterium]|nr:hypothetical protein [Actinomycetota bacterium]